MPKVLDALRSWLFGPPTTCGQVLCPLCLRPLAFDGSLLRCACCGAADEGFITLTYQQMETLYRKGFRDGCAAGGCPPKDGR